MPDPKNLADPKNQKKDPPAGFPKISVDIFAEERRQAATPDAVRHENVDVQSFLDYTGADLNLLTDDAEKLRARNQGFWEQAGAFANQAVVGEIIGGSLEGLGYLLDVKGMVDIAKGTEQEWGNWFSDIGKDIREFTQESTPIYQEQPGAFNPSDSGWWFGNGVSVASTLSLMIPSGIALKGLSIVGRGLSRGMRVINKGLDIAEKLGKSSKLIQNAVGGVTQALLSRHAENMMESSSMFDEKYKDLQEKGLSEEQARKRASEGASKVYGLNSAMLAQDIFQYTLLHRFTEGLSPTGAGKTLSGAASKLPGGRYIGMATDFASEAAEEAYQYVVQEEGNYIADVGAGVRDPSEFSDRLGEYMSDGELLTSAFFGGFGSFLMQSVGPSIMRKIQGQTGGFNTDPLANAQSYMTQAAQANKSIRAAKDQGLTDQADSLEDRNVVGLTVANLDRDQGDSHLSVMRSMEDMSPEEAQEFVSNINESSEITITGEDFLEKAKRHREVAEETSVIYNDLKDKYGKDIAGPATIDMMSNKLNRRKSKKKEQELSDHKSNIPEYEDLSSNGQTILDLEIEKAGLQRAKKTAKVILDNVESDEKLSQQYQVALSNIDKNLSTVNESLKREESKDYDDSDRSSDQQKMKDLDPFIEEGAKFVSEREIADQVANINRASYSSKIDMAKNKEKQKERKEATKKKQDFRSDTIATDEDKTTLSKGDPLIVSGQPGEYQGSYERGDETIHKIKDLSDPKGSNWEIPDTDFDEKVQRRKYRQDVADEQRERDDVSTSRQEQEEVRKSESPLTDEAEERLRQVDTGEFIPTALDDDLRQMAQDNGIDISPQDKAGDVIKKLRNKKEDGPQDTRTTPPIETGPPTEEGPPAGANIPTLPSQEKIRKQKQAAEANEKSSSEMGGDLDIMTPKEDSQGVDPHRESSKARQSKIEAPLSVAISSTNNPLSYINLEVERGDENISSDRYKDAKALTDFLENPVPVTNDDGTYAYYVKTEIDKDYLNSINPDLREKVDGKEILTQDELDTLPIIVRFYNVSDDSVVTQNGREVYSYLHTPQYISSKRFAGDNIDKARENLRQNRELAYSGYLDNTDVSAHIIRQEAGHFLKDPDVELGNFETYNFVHEVIGKNAEDIPIAILDSGGVYTDSTGNIHSQLSLKENAPDRAGAVYAGVTGANGSQKPMRLFADTFTDEEANLIYNLYRDIALGASPKSTLDARIKKDITNSQDLRINQIEQAVDQSIDDINYGDLLNFLVFEGKEVTTGKGLSQLWIDLAGEDSKLIYGTQGELSKNQLREFNGRDDFINWLQSNRRRQITRKLIDFPAYKKYVLENGILRTTAPVREDNRLLIGPTTVIGTLKSQASRGNIDYSEDTSKAPWKEDTDTGDKTIGDIFQKKSISSSESLPDSLGQRGMIRFLDRLQDRFNINYHVIDDPNVNWSGRIESGTVFINTANATLDTPFHEFAHPLVETIKRNNVRLYMGLVQEMRSSPQGRRILSRVQQAYKDHSVEQQYDEAIVQSIGEMAAGNIVEDQSSFKRFLRDLWVSLKRLMNRVFNVDTSVDPDQLSPNTSLKELSEMLSDDLVDIDLSGIRMSAEQRPKWMTHEQYRDWVDSMTYMVLNDNNAQDISDLENIKLSTIRDLISNTLKRMDSEDPLREQYQSVLNEITVDDSLELNPESDLLMSVQRRLRTFGVTPDQEVAPEQRDSRLNIRASYEFSNKEKASVNTKLMVAMIPKLNSSKLVSNKFGDNKPDYKISEHTGMPQFHNFGDTWNVLQRTLSDTVENVNEGQVEDLYYTFIDKLENASSLRPEIRFLINTLENSPEYKRTEFVQVLALASQNFNSTFFRRDGDGFKFKIGGADTQSIEDKIVDGWASNYRDKLARSVRNKEDQMVMTIDEEKAQELLQRYDDLSEGILEAAKSGQTIPQELKDSLQELLSDTGIEISDRGIDKLIQESKGSNPIDKLNTIVRGSQGSSIRFIYKQGTFSLEKLSGKPYVFSEENVRMSITEEAFIRQMASAESYFQNNLADSTIIGPDNKPFWTFSNYNSMYKKIVQWKSDTDSLKQILSASYNSNSVWGEWLLKSQENRDKFSLINFMNFRQEFTSDRGSKNTELGITDLLSDKLNRLLQGFFSLPARADNTTEYQIQGPPSKKAFRKSQSGRLELRDSAVDIIKGYVLDELSRIKHAETQIQNLPESEWIKDYHYKLDENGNKDTSLGNAFKIHLMPSLNGNPKLFNSRGKVGTITSEKIDSIESEIRDSFQSQFERDLDKMVKHRVITRKGGTLQNNAIDTGKMKYYTDEAGSEELGVQAAIMDYTFNGIIANQEWHKLFGGDIASYKSREDFQKRATAPGSTGLMYRIMEDMSSTYNSAVVNDIITQSELVSDDSIKAIANYTGNTQKDVREAMQAYNEVDRADAQAWITPEQYRDRMRGYGKWTPSHEEAYQRLVNGDQLPSDMKMFMQPLKTVHTEMKIENGNSIFHYNKQSEAVLHPDIADSLGLGNLLDAMRRDNVDHVIVESGKKSGAKGITSISDDSGEILDSNDIVLNSTTLDKRYLFLQQELPTKGMKPSKEGSQVRKNILEGVIPDQTYTLPNGEKVSGEEFLSEIHNTIGALSDKGLQEVLDFIEWDNDTGYNRDKLYDYIKRAFTHREVNDNLIEALNKKIPLDAIPQMRVAIENQLAAMINKKAVDLRHDTGGSYIQMSDVGFTTSNKGYDSDFVTWINEEAKSGLKPPRIDPKTGEFKPGQILLPHKVLKQMPGVSESDIKKLMKNISTGISYRIPNQSMSSNDVVEVVGILPEEMGDTVVAYKEVTTKYGSDFDIDKLQVMLPNYNIVDGKVEVIEFKNFDTNNEGKLRQLYRDQYQAQINFFEYLDKQLNEKQRHIADSDQNLIEFLDTTTEEDIVIDAERNITLQDYNNIRKDVQNIPSEEQFVEEMMGKSIYEINSKKAIQNRKLELYRAMLSNKDTYFSMIKPLESGWLKEGIRNNKDRELYEEDFEAFSPTTQAEIRKTFVDTKAAVGQIANHSTDHAFSQSSNLFLNKKNDDGSVSPHYMGIGNQTETENGPATSFSSIYDETGDERIMETLSAFMTANVDAAKDPYITDGNFNLFTNPVAMLLIRAGVPRQFVIDFMDQPVIRKYAAVTAEYEGRTSERYTIKGKGQVSAIEAVTWYQSKGITSDDNESLRTTDPNEIFEIESIDPRKLMKEINDNGATDDNQIKALLLFEQWRGFASALNQSIQASKADVNGMGASIVSATVSENMREKVEQDNIIGNFGNKFKGTFLENFYNNSVRIGQRIFGPSTFLHQTQAVKDVVEATAEKIGMSPIISDDIAFTLNAEAYAYLMSGTKFALTSKEMKSLFTGDRSMAKRLMLLKGAKDSPVKENPLIQYLGYKTANEEGGLDFIYGQGSKQLTVEAQNELTQAWNDLLLHDNKRVRQFAEDLGRYAYYSSGFRRNLTSFFELIPVGLNDTLGITEDIQRLQIDLETSSNPLAGATDQILKNLSDDGRIVPNISKNNLRQLDNIPTKKAFGLIPGDNKHLQVGTDESGNPVMKPFLMYNNQLFEYRGLGIRSEDIDGTIKESEMAVYVPTRNYGIKEGRFRIKEYNKNLTDVPSAFDQNNIELDSRVNDITRSMGVEMNYIADSNPRTEVYSPEITDESSSVENMLRNIEGISEEEIQNRMEQYDKLSDIVSAEEFVDGVKKDLEC